MQNGTNKPLEKSSTPDYTYNTNALISMLEQNPEGIVVYDRGKPHAIILTDYINGTFYCSDPASTRTTGRRPVSEASISLANMDAIWYMPQTYSITSEAPSGIESCLFDARLYYNLNSDLQQVFGYDVSALYNHWLTYGIKEGRVASIYFDAKWYLNYYTDLAAVYGSTNYAGAYQHFLTYGLKEGRIGSPYFSAKYYLDYYSDLKSFFGTDYTSALMHFNSYTYSGREDRIGSPNFSVAAYKTRYTDLYSLFANENSMYYIHYMKHGIYEGRIPY